MIPSYPTNFRRDRNPIIATTLRINPPEPDRGQTERRGKRRNVLIGVNCAGHQCIGAKKPECVDSSYQ